jgi:trehalose/maltose hydrolase-like predicted phosphorylase
MAGGRGWTVVKKEHDAESRRAHASVFTIANGYMALKGDLLEERGERYPTTFINGVFDVADMIGQIRVSKHERRYLDENYFDGAGPSPSIANLPNPLAVRVFVGDDEIVFERARISGFQRAYDLALGRYSYEYVYADAAGRRTRIQMLRACDMEHTHCAAMHYSITPLNYSATIRIMSGVDGDVRSNMTGDRQVEIISSIASRDKRTLLLEARTAHTGIGVKLAVQDRFSRKSNTKPTILSTGRAIWALHEFRARRNQPIALEKSIVVACSNDNDPSAYNDPAQYVRKKVHVASVLEFDDLWWRAAWKRLDVRIEGDATAQLALRFCLFHLMCAAPRHADAMSIPCKLLSGEHYQGTTFYDTDLYIEPVLTFTFPDVARRMLAYRCAGLGPGRVIAKNLGYRGAKFAWQAGPNGIEALGKWYRFTHTNIHINGDVAYSLMQYVDATGDTEFMRTHGAELLVETARFYASRARRNDDGTYSFADVAGPDEGHCESTDNYYTNLMAKKNLLAACAVVEQLAEEHPKDHARLVKKLKLDEAEPDEWRRVADGIRFLYDPATRIYEQYDGFYKLKPAPADLLEGRSEWFVTVAPYQALNQPDVVMAHVLFRDEIADDVKRANWEFYKGKSMNFSSMSFVVNAIMAEEMGEMDDAYRNFIVSAGMDLDPALTGRGDTGDGLHGTAMGGAWMAAVFGFGGVTLSKGTLLVEPRLPAHWKSLAFTLRIRGEDLRFAITHDHVEITLGKNQTLELPARIAGQDVILRSGESQLFDAG